MSDTTGLKEYIADIIRESEKTTRKLIIDKSAEMKSHIEATIHGLQTEVVEVKKKLHQLEIKERKKNLIIHGIDEPSNESAKDLHQHIKDIGEKLELEIDYDHTFRLGKQGSGKRPIMIKLLRTQDKFKIMAARNKLKDTGIYINEDMDPDTRKNNALLNRKQ